MQDELVRNQIRDSVAPFSPLWRRRFNELNRKAGSVHNVADLATIPAMGERDISPTGDPAGMASMVLQAGEAGYALHAPGPALRHALRVRAGRSQNYHQIVDADTRATSYVFSGSGFTYPIASTRSDLDIITRAGARLWSVLGLTGNDVLISAVEPAATTEHTALQYAAIGAGAPALFPGGTAADLAAAARLAPPTVLALPSATAPELIDGLSELASLRTVLMVGAPIDAERMALSHALHRAGAGDVTILAVHAPAGARVLWGECRSSGGTTGLHTYPDLEVVQVVDPDNGESTHGAGELVLTQLGMRGSALLRWRTADVVAAISTGACPSCRRFVPRLEGLQRSALVTGVGDGQSVDLRTIASALSGRTDLRDWRIVVGRRRRDGASQVIVHLVDQGADDAGAVIGAATDIRSVAGALPTQIVLGDDHDLAALYGTALSAKMLIAS